MQGLQRKTTVRMHVMPSKKSTVRTTAARETANTDDVFHRRLVSGPKLDRREVSMLVCEKLMSQSLLRFFFSCSSGIWLLMHKSVLLFFSVQGQRITVEMCSVAYGWIFLSGNLSWLGFLGKGLKRKTTVM